jgi:signal transduction histidine kinase
MDRDNEGASGGRGDTRGALAPNAGSELRLTEEHLGLAFDAAQVIPFTVDLAEGMVRFLPRAAWKYGLPPGTSEMPVPLWRSMIHPDDRATLDAARAAALGARAPDYVTEYRTLPLDGSAMWWASTRIRVVYGPDGEPTHFHGLDIDVTGAREREETLRSALQAAHATSVLYDFAADTVSYGDTAQMVAVDYPAPGEAVPLDTMLAPLPLDERARMRAALRDVAEGRTDTFFLDYRLEATRAGTRWHRASARAERDTDGRARRMLGIVQDITDETRQAEAMAARDAYVGLAFDAARAMPFTIDLTARQVRILPVGATRYGFPPGTETVSLAQWRATVHPDDLEDFEALIAEAFRARRSDYAAELRIHPPGGEPYWVQTRGRVIYAEDGTPLATYGIDIDITEAKAREQALAERERSLREALDAAGAAAISFDYQTGALRVGYHPWGDQALVPPGGPPMSLDAAFTMTHPDDREALWRALAATRDEPTTEITVDFRLAPEQGFVWLLLKGRIDRAPDGRPLRGTGFLIDVTKQKARERELEAARREAEQARAEARARARALAVTSHDVRQPLQAVNLFVRALEKRVTDPALADIVASLKSATGSMSRMVDALMDLARLDAGLLEPAHVALDLAEMAGGLAREFHALAEAKNIAFTVDVPSMTVRTDPMLLGMILRNLMANAVRFTAEGGVRLTARDLGRRVRIEVRDSGPGIPDDKRDAIFADFVRLDAGGVRNREGLGLGLAIVRRAADLLGATVEVESALGAGSVFRIDLAGG